MEPQIPGILSGTPTEGNPGPVQRDGGPGYAAGPLPPGPAAPPEGLRYGTMDAPKQRDYRTTKEWSW
jgi:hypothetical protein